MHRQETLSDRLLRLMSDGEWYVNDLLVQEVGHRFSATMHVLRQRGYAFEKRRIDGRRFEYRLVSSRSCREPIKKPFTHIR
jgi:hypothetical protein